jgi:hypothetical protein
VRVEPFVDRALAVLILPEARHRRSHRAPERRVCAQRPQHGKAVHVRHRQIDQHEIGHKLPGDD